MSSNNNNLRVDNKKLYVKKIIVSAEPFPKDSYVDTSSGRVLGKKGDYYVTGIDGSILVVEKNDFLNDYEQIIIPNLNLRN